MSDCDCSIEVVSRQQSRVLKTLLAINATMFVIELVTGILAESNDESITLLDQMQAFRRRHEHFALVVDEYGSLMGVITLEDPLAS